MRIDLHTHSTASDGRESPAEVIASAVQTGLDVVALTDHDTTAGWAQASAAAEREGIALVRGIEISCRDNSISIHLLGYLHDPSEPGLLDELEHSRESRATRAQRIVERISQDLPLDWDDVLKQIGPWATIGRPHIADAMVAKGIVHSRDEAFRDYLNSRTPYYATHYAVDAVQAV